MGEGGGGNQIAIGVHMGEHKMLQYIKEFS